jgi:hypothetical protein
MWPTGKVPASNPFAQMVLAPYNRDTPTATYAELETFRAKANELRIRRLGTATLIAWE